MPITSTQANVSLSTIQTEFGGTNPISLSEYYRGGSLVPNGPAPGASNTSGGISVSIGANEGTGNIPTSGQITVSSFRPSSKIISVTVTVSSNVTNMNLWSEITSRLGTINNQVNCTCTINSGVWVSSNSTSIPALTTGSGWPANSSLTIVNSGTIAGMGGAGGAGGVFTGSSGLSGGPAVNLTLNTTINNLGSIHGGGGGGGGGGGIVGINYGAYSGGGGGGGGRSYSTTTGGSHGSYSLWPGWSLTVTPTNGGSGTSAGGGSGGLGAEQSSGGEAPDTATGGNGGAGGTWGASGSSGATAPANLGGLFPSSYGGGAAGAGGYYLVKNGFSITWTTTGTRSGTEI